MLRESKLGPRIASLAEERGLDVTDLSRASGLKEGTLYKLLRGDQDSTAFEAGLRLAKALCVDPWELADVTPPPGDFRADLEGGGHLTIDVRVDRLLGNAEKERLRQGLRAAVIAAFPGTSVVDSDAAIKPFVAETEALVRSLQALQDSVDAVLGSQEALRKRVDQLERADREARESGPT